MKLTRMLFLISFMLLVLVSTGCKKDKDEQSKTRDAAGKKITVANTVKSKEVSVNNGSVTEGDEGTSTLKLTVTCSAEPRKNQDVTVKWSTSDAIGTSEAQATAGEDYTSSNGVVTFTKGRSLQQQISVPVKSDTDVEEDEIFIVTLEQPVNATIANGVGEALILNDDTGGGTPEVSNETKYANLPVGTVIADHFSDFSQSDYDRNASYSIIPVSGQEFAEALQIAVQSEPSSDYRVNMTLKAPLQLHQDDIILVSFYAKTIAGTGQLEFLLQHADTPYTEYVKWPVKISSEWKRYYIPFTVQVLRGMLAECYVPVPPDGDAQTFGVNEVRFRFKLGYYPQTIQLADMRIVDYGTSVTGPQLPVTSLAEKTDNIIIPGSSPDTGDANWTPDLLAQAEAGNMYLPDFSYAGYHNGEETFPDTSTWSLIKVEDYGAIPDDQNDDTAAIQRALTQAAGIPNPVVLQFPAGRFIISDLIILQRDYLVLRGAGSQSGGTVIAPSKAMKDMPTETPLILEEENYIKEENMRTDQNVLYSPFSWAGGVIWLGNTSPVGTTGTATRTNGIAHRGTHSIATLNPSGLTAGQTIQLRCYDNSSSNPLRDHVFDCVAADLPEGYGNDLPEEPEVWQYITIAEITSDQVIFKEPLNHDIRDGWYCELKTMEWLTEIGIEGIAIEFPSVNYAGHHIEEGYNGIYVNGAFNSWIKDVRVTNSDSGILIQKSKNITVQNVLIDGRGGHYSLMAGDSDQILFRNFTLNARSGHNPSFNTYCRTSVFTHGQVDYPVVDQHNGMNHQNLIDDLEFTGEVRHLWEHGGNYAVRPTHGAFNTAWNIRFHPTGKVPVLGTSILDGPSAYLIGLSSDATLMFTYGPGTYTEGLGRTDIAVPSLYDYQLERRLERAATVQ